MPLPQLQQTARLTGPHFRYEEESLYPALVQIFGEKYVDYLFSEHDRAIGRAGKLVELASKPALSDADVKQAEELIRAILPHVSDCDGLSKTQAKIDLWLRDVAPSDALRKWFAHEPAKWPVFQRRYRTELTGRREAIQKLKQADRIMVQAIGSARRGRPQPGTLHCPSPWDPRRMERTELPRTGHRVLQQRMPLHR